MTTAPALRPHGSAVPPNSLADALAHVEAGGKLAVVTCTRAQVIDAKCLARWVAYGTPLLRERENGYQMRQGRGSVFLLPGVLRYVVG